MPRPNSFFVRTFGCQMNAYDSERMEELLLADGLEPAATAESADLVVLNTCHIREKAAEKVYSEIGRMRGARAAAGKARPLLVVAGCVAQAEGAEIIDRAPAVDLVVGPQSYYRLPALVRDAASGGATTGRSALDMPALAKFDSLPPRRTAGPSAYLTVQEGCDKFCTFCVVPYTRGAEVARPVAAVLDEARALVDAGARELVLLGQNVNAYHGADEAGRPSSLALLVRRLAELPGLERIRYTTSHPRDMTEELMEAHAEVPQLMPYLHLPVQAGSDRVLRAMNRAHTAGSYVRTVERLRARRPDIALSGDFIVGFPGETRAEFEETLRLVERVTYAQAFSFKYSPRPGTPAAALAEQVDEAEKSDRLAELQALLSRQQAAFNARSIGREVEVLLERPGRRPGQLIGRSPHFQSVHVVADPSEIGRIVPVHVAAAGPHSLEGARPDQRSSQGARPAMAAA